MSKTYTFPTQTISAGVLSFEVLTSTGSGTSAMTSNYFSDKLNIVNETELIGGELKSAFADFTIDYDEDGLFKTTILPVALTFQQFVTVKVKCNDEILFWGTIEPSTISYSPFYNSDDTIEGSLNSISFRCIWIMSLLKNISKSDLGNQLFTTLTSDDMIRITSSPNDVVWGAKISKLLNACISYLQSEYGYTFSLNYEQINYRLFSKEGSDTAVSDYPFVYNYLVRQDTLGTYYESGVGMGEVAGVDLFDSYLIWQDRDAPDSATPSLFSEFDTKLLTGYDFFTEFIKSFGIICKITHNETTNFVVSFGTRVSGDNILLSEILDSPSINPLSTLAREGAKISSLTSGNSFDKQFNGLGTSVFSSQVVFDFGNDYDFCGGYEPVNSIFSLAYPIQNPSPITLNGIRIEKPHFSLMRYAGVGENKITNANFGDGLNGWTADSGTWSDSIFSPIPTAASVAMGDTSPKQLSWTLSEELDGREKYILSALFQKGFTGGSINLKIRFWYNDPVSGVGYTEEEKTISDTNLRMQYAIRSSIFTSPLTKISFVVTPSSAFTVGDEFFITSVQLYNARKGTPEILGKDIEKYFNGGNMESEQFTLNGIRSDIGVRDYYLKSNGDKYFVKKIRLDLSNNETEIEAINYPY